MENKAASFLVVPNKDRPPEGYNLSTLSQAKPIESMRRAYESSKAFGEKESVRLKNGLLDHQENIELLMERRYQSGLKYKLVSNSKMAKELPKEDCLVALAYAVENDDVEVVKEVVECAGLDILRTRFASVGSGTILHMCTHWSSVNTLEMVLEEYPRECFDLFSVDDDGETALHNLPNFWSIEKSYLDCKKAALLLLRFDAANVNKLLGVQSNRPNQMTALCKALVYEMQHVCQALLDAAASTINEKPQKCVTEETREDQTSQKSATKALLDAAASTIDEKPQKCATEETREDQTSRKSATEAPLDAAASTIDKKLQKCATEGSTWLSLEAYGKCIAAVFKDNDDDEEDEEEDGAFCSTALHLAIGTGYADIATKILKHPGAESLNLTSLMDSNGNTPLHVAAMVGDSESCATLLNNGTLEPDKARSGGVQSLNKRGETPLHIASAQGHPEVCKKLLECQAPLLVRDVDGRYPLTNALMEGHLEVVKMLLNACLHSASKSKGHGKSKAISKDINGQLELGFTPLHVAAAICSLNHVKKLIEAGADINCISDDHLTPLHLATSSTSNETSTADEKSSASTEDESRSSIVKKSSEITKEANSPRKLEEKSSETAEANTVTDAESSDSTVKVSSEATKEANNPRKGKENITSAVIKESSSEMTEETATNEGSSDPRVEESSEITREANNPRIEGREITDKQVENVCDVVSLFLNEGARVDLQDYKGETPLHNAAQYCHYDVLRTLLLKAEHGHNFKNSKEQWICMCNFAGQTALHQLADQVDDPSIEHSVGFLLSQTSSPNDLLRIRDTNKMTALDLAAQKAAQNAKYKSKLIHKMLKASGIDDLTKGFLMWSLREHKQVTDANTYCQKYGVDKSQTRLLQAAVDNRDLDIARELVNTGADVTALDFDDQIWLAENLRKVASDQPTLEDSLGRRELVQAVATLLLNPYTETPVTIGIFGSWGAGKSSFMLQVEEAMLSMNVKEIFRKTPCSSSLTKFSRGGNCLRSMVLRALKQRMTKAKKFKQKAYGELRNDDDIIYKFPMELQKKYHQLFRSLALTDRSKLLLRAINLILGSCGINVVIGVDKDMLQLAIAREFLKDSSDNIFDVWVDSNVSSQETNAQVLENVDGKPTLESKDSKNEEKGKMNANVDKHSFMSEFANRYLQKIIHLPIQMPEPSKQHLKKFLECHVGPKKKQKDESTIKNQEDKQGKIEDKSNERKHEVEIAIVGENSKDEKKPIKNDGFSQSQVSVKGQKVHVKEEEPESDDEAIKGQKVHVKEEDPESDDGAIKLFCIGAIKGQKMHVKEEDPESDDGAIKGQKMHAKEEDLESDDGAIEPIVYRLLVANFTPLEKDMLMYLCQFTTKERNLPREWKRFLNYHRLAWTILSNDCTMKEDKFKGWQRKLIIWIFICWNWRPQMDAIFKNWHEITSKKSKRQTKLQLQDAKQDGGTGLKLLDVIGTYIDSMKGNTLHTTSKNMGKQADEVVSKAWIELQTMIKDKNDIPLKFVGKFQQFRFYCVLNHLEINE